MTEEKKLMVFSTKLRYNTFLENHMARKNPLTEQELTDCRRMMTLRESLKISRVAFGLMMGMGENLLQAKEVGRIPFRSEEIVHIQAKVRIHLAASHTAAEAAFGEPAFPSTVTNLDLNQPRHMKLPPLTDQQRHQVETALKQVESIFEVLPPWVKHLDGLRREAADVEAEAEQLQASGKHDRKTVTTLQGIGAQRTAIAEKIAADEADFAAQRRASTNIVRGTAALIYGLCWPPLSGQLRQRATAALIVALAPFGVEPARNGLTEEEFLALPATRELLAFCNDGRNFGFDSFNNRPSPAPATAENVLARATSLKATLNEILQGKDVFTYTPPSFAEAV